MIGGHSSSTMQIKMGASQGSILGPLLFLIYINDFPFDTSCNIIMYADDISISFSFNSFYMNVAYKRYVYSNGKDCKWLQMVNGKANDSAICRGFPDDELPYLRIDLGEKYSLQKVLVFEAQERPQRMKLSTEEYIVRVSSKKNIPLQMAIKCSKLTMSSKNVLEFFCSKYINFKFFRYVWVHLDSSYTNATIGFAEIEVYVLTSIQKKNLAFGKKVYYGRRFLEVYSTKPTSGFGSYFEYKADWLYVELSTRFRIGEVVIQTLIEDKKHENAFDMFVVRLTNLKPQLVRFSSIRKYYFCNQYPYEARVVMVVVCQRTIESYEGVIIHKDLSRTDTKQMKVQSIEVHMRNSIIRDNFMGCYKNTRRLYPSLKKMKKVEECMLECEMLGMPYTFITIPNRCYCSNEVDTNKAVRLRRCYAVCPGDQNPCGGYKLYSVYKTNLVHQKGHQFVGCYAHTWRVMTRFLSNLTINDCLKYCHGYSTEYVAIKGKYCECINDFDRLVDCKKKYKKKIYKVCNLPCKIPISRCFGNLTLKSAKKCLSNMCQPGWGGESCLERRCHLEKRFCKGKCLSIPAEPHTGDVFIQDCMCQDGFIRSKVESVTCNVDINECEEGVCGIFSFDCNNTYGSYVCRCKEGFTYLDGTCKDRDECQEANVCNQFKTVCINQIGSFQCFCEPGYMKKGESCVKIISTRYKKSTFNPTTVTRVTIIISLVSFFICIILTISKTRSLMMKEKTRVQIQRFENKGESQ